MPATREVDAYSQSTPLEQKIAQKDFELRIADLQRLLAMIWRPCGHIRR